MTPIPKLGAPAIMALSSHGVNELEDLSRFSEIEVTSWHGIGPKALRLLRQSLTIVGLSYKE